MPSKSERKNVGSITTCVLAVSSATTGVAWITESATLTASDAAAEVPLSAT
jgi:hypothetical protein